MTYVNVLGKNRPKMKEKLRIFQDYTDARPRADLPRARARFDDEETAVRLADEVMKMDNSVIYELMESPTRLTEVLRTLHGRERDRRIQ